MQGQRTPPRHPRSAQTGCAPGRSNADPGSAIEIVRRASQWSPAGEHQIRLAALEARCAARLGRRDEALTAVTRALAAAEATPNSDEVVAFGGSLQFPTPKLAHYLGTTIGSSASPPMPNSGHSRRGMATPAAQTRTVPMETKHSPAPTSPSFASPTEPSKAPAKSLPQYSRYHPDNTSTRLPRAYGPLTIRCELPTMPKP